MMYAMMDGYSWAAAFYFIALAVLCSFFGE